MSSLADKSTMKNLVLALTLTFTSLYCQRPWAAEEAPNDYAEMINSINGAQGEVKKAGVVDPGCVNCVKTIEPNKKIELKNKVEDLETPFIYKDNTPYIIHVKRTKDSPLKATLKFRNGHSECANMFIGSNPWNPSGPLVIGCAYTHTVYEDHEIDLNMKNLPKPAEGEEQIIEIRITKPKVENSYYAFDAEVIKGPSTKVEKDKKFWGSGFNLDFSSSDGK